MAGASNALLVISAVFYAFFYFSVQPVQNYILSNYLPRHRHGLGYGLHFSLTFGVGSTAAAISGYIADHFGLQAVFYTMVGCFALAAATSAVLMVRVNRSGK
jgi:MFS family permease